MEIEASVMVGERLGAPREVGGKPVGWEHVSGHTPFYSFVNPSVRSSVAPVFGLSFGLLGSVSK